MIGTDTTIETLITATLERIRVRGCWITADDAAISIADAVQREQPDFHTASNLHLHQCRVAAIRELTATLDRTRGWKTMLAEELAEILTAAVYR